MSIELLIEKLEEERDELVDERSTIDADIARIELAITALSGREVVAAPVATTKPAPTAKPSPKPATASGRPSKYDYAEVARVAIAAIEGGKAAGPAVAAYFGVTAAMSRFLIANARKLGHDIPKKVTGRPPKPAFVFTTPDEIRTADLEHKVETERNGWKPGMAAEVLGV
jgi:hypothetical protein